MDFEMVVITLPNFDGEDLEIQCTACDTIHNTYVPGYGQADNVVTCECGKTDPMVVTFLFDPFDYDDMGD